MHRTNEIDDVGLRESFNAICRTTEPGPARDKLLAHLTECYRYHNATELNQLDTALPIESAEGIERTFPDEYEDYEDLEVIEVIEVTKYTESNEMNLNLNEESPMNTTTTTNTTDTMDTNATIAMTVPPVPPAAPGFAVPTPEEHAAAVAAERAKQVQLNANLNANLNAAYKGEPSIKDKHEISPEVKPEAKAETKPVPDTVEDLGKLLGEPAGGNTRTCSWEVSRARVNAWCDAGYTPTQILRGLTAVGISTEDQPKLVTLRSYMTKRRANAKKAASAATTNLN